MRHSILFALAIAASAQTVDPNAPSSVERRTLVEKLRKQAEAISARFEAHSFSGGDGHAMPYRLFRPPRLDEGRTYPLVVYLHGAGGSGTDNRKQYTGGNLFGSHVWALEENQRRQPAFVIAPQTDRGWVSRPNPKAPLEAQEGVAPGVKLLFELLDTVVRKLPVDTRRIYVTGQSMGGYGSWYAAMLRPDFFAAAVPICGGGMPARAGALKRLPVWAFHGTSDQTVPVQRSRETVDALRNAGGKPMLTEYEGVGHNSWEFAYSEPGLPRWVYAQHQ